MNCNGTSCETRMGSTECDPAAQDCQSDEYALRLVNMKSSWVNHFETDLADGNYFVTDYGATVVTCDSYDSGAAIRPGVGSEPNGCYNQ